MDSDSSTKQKQAELRSRQGEAHEGSAPYCLGIFMQMALVENRESTCFAPVDFFQALTDNIHLYHVSHISRAVYLVSEN